MTDAVVTELHRQSASMFLCWPTNAVDLAKNDSDLPELIEKLAGFIARWEQLGRTAQPQSLTGCQLRGPGECQKEGKCMSASCVHFGKTTFRPRMTVLAQVDGILYPKETR